MENLCQLSDSSSTLAQNTESDLGVIQSDNYTFPACRSPMLHPHSVEAADSKCTPPGHSSISDPRRPRRSARAGPAGPAWLSLILVVLAVLANPVCSQSTHWYLNGSTTMTGFINPLIMWSGLRTGETTTMTAIFDLKNDYSALNGTCNVGVYMPTYQNESKPASVFAVSCPYTTISSLAGSSFCSAITMVNVNKKTGKVAFITRVTSDIVALTIPQLVGSDLSETLMTSVNMQPGPGLAVEGLMDIEGTTKMMAVVRGTNSQSPRAFVVDVASETPTAGSPILFSNTEYFMTVTVTLSIASQKIMLLGGFFFSSSGGVPSKNNYFYLYDIYSNPSTFTFKASWKNTQNIASLTIADNLNNQDYIYTVLVDALSLIFGTPTYSLAMIKISGLIGAQTGIAAQLGDIFDGVRGMKFLPPIAGGLNIMNMGIFNYLMAISLSTTYQTKFTLYPKDFANFGQTSSELNLPAFGSQTKGYFAYGFFRYDPSEPFSLYYQTTNYQTPILKASLFQCLAGSQYFHYVDKKCYSDSALPPSGYMKDTALYEYVACSVNDCDTCPASAATCTNCKAGFSLIGNTCITCRVDRCASCDTSDHCVQCTTGYLLDGSNLCPTNSCDTGNGYTYNTTTGLCAKPCTAGRCETCLNTDGTKCIDCKVGWLDSAVCNQCDTAQGYAMVGGDCVLQCSAAVSNCAICATTTTCQSCMTGYLGSTCGTCDIVNSYQPVGSSCVLQCPSVSRCSVCETRSSCKICNIGYLGSDCLTCDEGSGYELVVNECKIRCPSIPLCNICGSKTSCQVCKTGLTGSKCDSCATGYLPDPNDSTNCIQCSVSGCSQCSSPNVCSKCSAALAKPSTDGSQCLIPVADSCKATIVNCSVCESGVACQTCKSGFTLSTDKSRCSTTVDSCSVEHCAECESESQCSKCKVGYQLSENHQKCSFHISKSKIQVFTSFDSEAQEAFVQLTIPSKNFDLKAFVCRLLDKITGQVSICKDCSAKIVEGYSKALQFIIQFDVELLSATLQCSYPLSSVKSSRRQLQTTEEMGYIVVDDLRVIPAGATNHDKMAYRAYTAVNTLRFFTTVTLGFLGTVHGFWSTNHFSWMQLWSLLPGKFLSYSDRMVRWHFTWFLLVIDFGDPFKSWVDWNTDGIKCAASESYPTNQLACSFVNNFGQNFIIIVVIFLICLVTSAVLFALYFMRRRKEEDVKKLRYQTEAPPPIQTDAPLPAKFTEWVWYKSFGLPYFVRWLDSIQPSLMYFSLLQFATYKNTGQLGASTFFAVFFFLYFMAAAGVSVLLARKIRMTQVERMSYVADLAGIASEAGWLQILSFHYIGMTRADYFWQLLHPLAEYVRVLFVCIFLVSLRNQPQAAVGLILVIELLKAAILGLMHRQKASLLYAVQDYVVQGFFLLFIILKLAGNDTESEESAQMKAGLALAVIWGILWAVILVNIIIEAGLHIWPIIQKCRNPGVKQPQLAIAGPVTTTRQVINFEVEENPATIKTKMPAPIEREVMQEDLKEEDLFYDEEQSEKNHSPISRSKGAQIQMPKKANQHAKNETFAVPDPEKGLMMETGSRAHPIDARHTLIQMAGEQGQSLPQQQKPMPKSLPKLKIDDLKSSIASVNMSKDKVPLKFSRPQLEQKDQGATRSQPEKIAQAAPDNKIEIKLEGDAFNFESSGEDK